jgi:Uma2 family endonuclease
MAVAVARRLLTAEEFVRMSQAGILRNDERLELVQGEIVQMAPIGARHHACVMWLTRALGRGVGDRALVSVQGPLELGRHNVLYPDLVLLRPRADGYRTAIPTASDAPLVVEVSDTTIEYDRGVKLRLYADAGVSEVWIADLTMDRVEVCQNAGTDQFIDVRRLMPGESLTPSSFQDIALSVSEILSR